jgi:putative flavoprotein involved in K+ transport
VTDEVAYPVTDRGETTAAGLYFLGLNFLHTRKSGIVYGVGADAEHVATQLRAYLSSE